MRRTRNHLFYIGNNGSFLVICAPSLAAAKLCAKWEGYIRAEVRRATADEVASYEASRVIESVDREGMEVRA